MLGRKKLIATFLAIDGCDSIPLLDWAMDRVWSWHTSDP